MAGLVGIPLGIAMVEFGPLTGLHSVMKTFVVKNAEGGSVTISSLTGLPFWMLALGFGGITLIIAFLTRGGKTNEPISTNEYSFQRLMTSRWKPWMAGLAIGILAIAAYLSSAASGRNYPLGVSHGVLQAELLITDQNFNHVWKKAAPKIQAPDASTAAQTAKPSVPQKKKIVWWLVALITSLIAGSWVSGRLSGEARLLPKPPEQTFVAFFGGILVGVGAAFAGGCVVGNILSGWALMSVGTILFGAVTILANWITTYFYLMGGAFSKRG